MKFNNDVFSKITTDWQKIYNILKSAQAWSLYFDIHIYYVFFNDKKGTQN